MKNLLSYSLLTFLLFATNLFAQDTYKVAGEQLSLKTEVDGTISLLWNVIDGDYRYFLKKDTHIIELTNTKAGGDYKEEYKQVLQAQTSDEDLSEDKVKLTTISLSEYFNEYNKKTDPNFIVEENNIKLKTRLGAFVGVTNASYSKNPSNQSLPTLGLDFEIVDNNYLKRHSIVLQFKQTFESSDYKYSSSQISLNYRFKFIKKEKLDVFINTKIAGYESITKEITVIGDNDLVTLVSVTNDSFQGLFNFGIGADYALGNGYLSFSYNDIVSFTQDTYGEFPLDFTLGYKLNL